MKRFPSLNLAGGVRSVYFLLIAAWAALFGLFPQWITGIPLSFRLEPDAEFFVVLWQTILHPDVLSRDMTLPRELPAGEMLTFRFLAETGEFLHLDPYSWSVTLSFLFLFVFLAGVYAVVRTSTGKSSYAFWMAFLCVIPVKMLGASRFGVRAGGFVPQHLALAAAVWLLVLYFYGVRRESKKVIGFYFLACGLLANLYPQFWVQTAGTMIVAEALRVRKFSPLVIYGPLVALAAFPTLYSVLSRFGWSQSVDLDLMRSRYPYLILYPVSWRTLYYLKSFIVFGLVNLLFYLWLFKGKNLIEEEGLAPWWAVMQASFAISLVGLAIESFTPWTRFLLSRASIWFAFSSLTIAAAGLSVGLGNRFPNHKTWLPFFCFAGFFLFQSEAVPSAVKMARDYRNRANHRQVIEAALMFRDTAGPEDIILVPSGPDKDLAHTVRAYALRGVYATYKDGGVALIDGEKGRAWIERYERQTNILEKYDADALVDFMRKENIAFALLPIKDGGWSVSGLEPYRFAESGDYLIIKVV